jgi:deoxyribonuclease V
VSPKHAIEIQKRLAKRVRASKPTGEIRLVAGADAAFSPDGASCIAAVVVWDLLDRKVVEEKVAVSPLRFPYVPGLLSFREAPAVLAALRKVRRRPELILYDGHGRAHPRRFGIACHVGVISGIPTAGCAKSRLVGCHSGPAHQRGSRADLIDRDEIIGGVLRTQDGVRPVFVSVGHKIDQPTAERYVLQCAIRYRLPEPTRLADILVARVKRQLG